MYKCERASVGEASLAGIVGAIWEERSMRRLERQQAANLCDGFWLIIRT